jgi:hypothetical protein
LHAYSPIRSPEMVCSLHSLLCRLHFYSPFPSPQTVCSLIITFYVVRLHFCRLLSWPKLIEDRFKYWADATPLVDKSRLHVLALSLLPLPTVSHVILFLLPALVCLDHFACVPQVQVPPRLCCRPPSPTPATRAPSLRLPTVGLAGRVRPSGHMLVKRDLTGIGIMFVPSQNA